MPKAILSFKIPEEDYEFECAVKGIKYLTILDELDNFLRSKIKYGDNSEEALTVYQEIRDKLWGLRNDE